MFPCQRWNSDYLVCVTPKPPHPVDVAWLTLCEDQSQDYDVIHAFVDAVVEQTLSPRDEKEARAVVARAMARLRLESIERCGVRVTLASARTRLVGDELVVLGGSWVRVQRIAEPSSRLRAALTRPGVAGVLDALDRRERLCAG